MERKKANVHDLYALDIPYFCFEPVINRVKNIKGTRYLLSKPLTETQKESIGKFKNLILETCHYKYAPEIRHDVIILTEKCL